MTMVVVVMLLLLLLLLLLMTLSRYGIITACDRETWDLPEDEEHSQLVRELEATNTLSWKVRLYRNERPFPMVAVEVKPAGLSGVRLLPIDVLIARPQQQCPAATQSRSLAARART